MIWCVEDDASIRDIELYALRSMGFEACGFEDGASCWEALKTQRPELILLDVMLPGMDGVALLRKMKDSPTLREIPVIMATAKGTEYDKIQSLDLGADDYLVKPFAFDELLARIRALSRKRVGHRSNRFTVADLTLDVERRQAFRGEREIHLLPKEFSILECLMRSKGNVLSRRQIEDSIWNYDDSPSSNNVDVYISKLRKKIDGDEPVKLLHTIRGVGWSLREPTGADTAETEKEV